MAILHYIFIKEDETSITLKEDDLEASALYSDYQYTSVNDLIDSNRINFKNIKLSTFIWSKLLFSYVICVFNKN